MPEDNQQNRPIAEENERGVSSRLVGAASLVFLGIAGASLSYAFFNGAQPPVSEAEAAAAGVLSSAFNDISLQAKSAYVYDIRDNRVLFQKNPDAQLPIASLTKVPLVLSVIESMPLDTKVSIPFDTAPAGSTMRLARGETWSLQDVINFTLIASSNQGADILAQISDRAILARYPDAPAGSAALWRMNRLASQLGLTNTYFINDNGLDISTTQAGAYGSARDMAMLFAYAASTSLPAFAGTTRDNMLLTDEAGHTTSAINTNEALGQIPGLIMGKTGYTDLAGGNLAIVFDVGLAHPVVAVVLGSTFEGRFNDMKALVDATRKTLMQ